MMVFQQLFDPETWTYTYLVADPQTREAALIDTVKEQVESYMSLLSTLNLTLRYILDTHVHADHITAAVDLRERTGALSVMGELTRAACVGRRVHDKETFSLGALPIQVIFTPGHTPCHVAYLIEDRLFTGDALLINGCGRTDFQGGSAKQLWHSVTQRLFSLPPDTLVYPGHDYTGHRVSSVQQEKDINPRFKGQTEETFISLMDNLKLPPPRKISEAVPANEQCGRTP